MAPCWTHSRSPTRASPAWTRCAGAGGGPWRCVVAFESALSSGSGQLDVASVERGLNVLLEACERAIEGIGSSVPAVQLRALLIIDGAHNLDGARCLRDFIESVDLPRPRTWIAGVLADKTFSSHMMSAVPATGPNRVWTPPTIV